MARTWLTVPGAPSIRSRVHRLDGIDDQQRRRVADRPSWSEYREPRSPLPAAPARRRARAGPHAAAPARPIPRRKRRRRLLPVAGRAAPRPGAARVDLPIPGSPPTSIAEPATIPPPIARSNSASPLGSRSGSAAGRLESHQRDHPPAALQIVLRREDARHFGGFLDQRVPLGTVGTLALPAAADRSAGLAHIARFGLRHV